MLKQVIVIRTDAGMGKGKMCGQTGHAAIAAYAASKEICYHPLSSSTPGFHDDCPHTLADKWLADIQTKVVLKVGSEDELNAVLQRALDAGLIAAPIHDAGHTQIEAGTFTCVGLGPDEAEKLNAVTGELKLL